MPEHMTPEEMAQFHRWKNEEAPRRMIGEMVEQKICEVWDIRWDINGSHWAELRAMRDDVKEMRRRLRAREGFVAAASATFRDKALNIGWGMLLALAAAWLATKLGVHLPGVTP